MNKTAKIIQLQELWNRSVATFPPSLAHQVSGSLAALSQLTTPVIAFSGGVDSAVVAALLTVARREPAELLTAVGPALASRQRAFADRVAIYLGAHHRWIDAEEILNQDYKRNDENRCFHCKTQLYSAVQRQMEDLPGATLLNGTNADDLKDYRPGLAAARNFQVRSPLAEAGFSKSTVRQLASAFGLPVADLPASPCLASRIQYGTSVTRERLSRIEKAEELLWDLNFSDVRVRLLNGEIASIEVPLAETARFEDVNFRQPIVAQLERLGFSQVSIQKDGLKSGRLNEQLVPIGRFNRD